MPPTGPTQSGAPPRPPGTSSLDESNRIVLEFSHKKGYSRTEAMSRLESTRQATQAAGGPPYTTPVPIAGPESYAKAYGSLMEWVDSSLDMYQPESNRFMFPSFVLMFLELVSLGEPERSQDFFRRFSSANAVSHPQDSQAIQGIRSPQHIEENSVAQRFMTQRYRIRISPTTFDSSSFFSHSIEGVGGSTIIRSINQHFVSKIVPKSATEEEDVEEEEANVQSQQSNIRESHRASKLGRMPLDPDFRAEVSGMLEHRDKTRAAERGNKSAGSSGGSANGKDDEDSRNSRAGGNEADSGFSRDDSSAEDQTKKGLYNTNNSSNSDGPSSAAQPKLADVFAEDTKPESDSPATDALPSPHFKPADVMAEVERIVGITERARIGYGHGAQPASPSVAMYTFHNTNDDSNCVAFSEDAASCAGGFSDSYVMLWSSKGKKLSSTIASENAEDQGPTRRLIGHSGAVYGLSFSPDGRTSLTASEDHTVRSWSMDTYTALVAYRGHTEPVWDVAFSPFGHYFVTASHDQTARSWSVDHIYPLRIFAGHMSDVDCVCFHPNGSYVVTGSTDRTVRMWDVLKGDCVRVFIGHVAGVTAVAVSPNGRWIASAGEDAVINIWDIGTGRRIKKMRGHGLELITSSSFSMGGEVLVSGAMDCTVRVWDMNKNTAEQGPQPEAIDGLADAGSASGPTTNGASAKGASTSGASTGASGESGSASQAGADKAADATRDRSASNGEAKQDGKRKEIQSTTDHMAVFNTKRTPVYKVSFTNKNLVLAAGALTL